MMRLYRHILILTTALFSAAVPSHAQTWTELSGDISSLNFTDGGHYRLVGNTTTTKHHSITGSITLDLNGYTLVREGSGQIFHISAYGHTITIQDSRPGAINQGNFGPDGASVTIEGGVMHAEGGTRGGIIYINGGHLIHEGGTLAGGKVAKSSTNTTVYGCGGGVYIDNGAFTMNGGHIAYCMTESNANKSKGGAVFINGQNNSSATFTLTGSSSIYGCKSERGGAVYVHTNRLDAGTSIGQGRFLMTGGSIKDCSAVLGGGVMVSAGSLFEMSGGTIAGNAADTSVKDFGGGGIFVNQSAGDNTPQDKAGTFTMTGGSITGNTTGGHGCGIHATGIVNISGGTISGNKPTGWQTADRYTTTMASDDEEGDPERVYGGGIYIRYGSVSKITISGEAVISDNVADCGGGIYIRDGMTLTMSAGSITNNRALRQKAENNARTIAYGGGGIYVDKGCTFGLTGGILTGNKTTGYGNAVLSCGSFTMNGGEISANIPGDYSEGEDYVDNTHGGGVCLYAPIEGDASTFTMESGSIVNNMGASGGGVMLWKNSQFKMNGGTMSGNKAVGVASGWGNGGAVYVNSSSTFTFNDGEITGNESYRFGGAININEDNTNLILNKGTISANRSRKNGGGISQENGTCSMTVGEDITLSDNTAEESGGGIYVLTGEVTLNGCRILRNKAGHSGGGICMKSGNLTINSGTLSDNEVTYSDDEAIDYAGYGGAVVLMESGTMTVSQAECLRNIAPKKGGCIYVKGSLNVTGKLVVKNNYAGEEAGAILVDGGNLEIADCDITGNKAGYDNEGNLIKEDANGGAMSIADGSVTITKGVISENICTGNGGGLYVSNIAGGAPKSVELLGGGTFMNNRAQLGGGLYVSGNIDMAFQGNIALNLARCGGGILLDGSKLTIKGGIIRNNRALPDPSSPDAEPGSNKPETGYLTDVSDLTGIGGGIYLNSGSTLDFQIESELGVYENDATWGADDIFANGDGTTVTLPDVKDMTLTGYRVPTTELYWAEDYITDDTNYGQGTMINSSWSQAVPENSRYDDAILDPAKYKIYKIDGGLTESTKYISLEIGYAYLIIDLIKEGLKKGESTVIVLTPAKEEDTVNGGFKVKEGEEPYLTIIFTCDEDEVPVRKQVLLPSGWWQMEETAGWAWAYDIDPNPKRVEEVTLEKQGDARLEYRFENTRKDKNSIPETFESIVVNRMKSPVRR